LWHYSGSSTDGIERAMSILQNLYRLLTATDDADAHKTNSGSRSKRMPLAVHVHSSCVSSCQAETRIIRDHSQPRQRSQQVDGNSTCRDLTRMTSFRIAGFHDNIRRCRRRRRGGGHCGCLKRGVRINIMYPQNNYWLRKEPAPVRIVVFNVGIWCSFRDKEFRGDEVWFLNAKTYCQ